MTVERLFIQSLIDFFCWLFGWLWRGGDGGESD